LVHELGRKTSTSTSQLLDIATNFASGEEAVGAIFFDGAAKGKQKAEATEASGSRDPKKKRRQELFCARAGGRRSKPPRLLL